jgi:hypothetical protein
MTRREITVYDQASDTETTVVIEREGPRGPRIIAVRLAVRDDSGPGLSSEHLLLLEDLGLPLPRNPRHDDRRAAAQPGEKPAPQPAPEDDEPAALPFPEALPGVTPPASKAAPPPAKKARANKQPASLPWLPSPPAPKVAAKPVKKGTKRNAYRRRPAPAVLVTAYEKTHGSPKAMAEMFDVPTYTMQSWMGSARKEGILPASTHRTHTTPEEES